MGTTGSVFIGIVFSADANIKYLYTESWMFDSENAGQSYQLYLDNYSNWENGTSFTDKGEEKCAKWVEILLKPGMILSMKVDFDDCTIRFYIDGKEIALPMDIEKNKEYFVCIERSC